jgi:hypothetical protein
MAKDGLWVFPQGESNFIMVGTTERVGEIYSIVNYLTSS